MSSDIVIEDVATTTCNTSTSNTKEDDVIIQEKDNDDHMDIDERELLVVFIERLKQLDAEAKVADGQQFDKCKLVIKEILLYIEKEYGFEEMVELIKLVSMDIGHPLAPIDKSIRKKLVRLGWIYDKVTNDVRILNDSELVALFESK